MNDIREKFVENAKIYNENLNLGNSKIANNVAKVLSKMSEKMIKQETHFDLVDNLLNDENPGVRYWVSSVALLSGYRRKEAISTLLKMSKDKNIGAISMCAYITAEECQKRGWIR